ncbi:hypothetical protein Mapa_008965 [Marchantia paleacea]|nr:hypothetical protein Mapa_008965 [Marchantia paleacea]
MFFIWASAKGVLIFFDLTQKYATNQERVREMRIISETSEDLESRRLGMSHQRTVVGSSN